MDNRTARALAAVAAAAVLSRAHPLPTARGKMRVVAGTARRVGAQRSDHVHAGVDLVTVEGGMAGMPVAAPLPGVVVKVGGWEGAGTDRVTYRVEILTPVGLVVLGALTDVTVREGQPVYPGQIIARVGVYPHGDSMLHVEWWLGPRGRWLPGQRRPVTLLNALYLMLAVGVRTQ